MILTCDKYYQMHKLLSVLPLLFLLSACNANDFNNEPEPEPTPPIVDPDPQPKPRVFTINWEEVAGIEYDSHGADGVYMEYKHPDNHEQTNYTLYPGTISGDFYYLYKMHGNGSKIADERVTCNKTRCKMNTMHPDISPVSVVLVSENQTIELTYSYSTYNTTNHEWEGNSLMTVQLNPMDYAEGVRYLSIDPVTQEITVDDDQETANNHFENP